MAPQSCSKCALDNKTRKIPTLVEMYNFIIELSPLNEAKKLPNYYAKVKCLLRYTRKVSITSHPNNYGSGFDRAYKLADYLMQFEPDIDIRFHLTCKDLNRADIGEKLGKLVNLGIKKLLVISGEDYRVDHCNQLQYSNSTDLINDIVNHYDWFESIAIASYPGSSCEENSKECQRLEHKLMSKVDTIITQCIFEAQEFSNFTELLKHHNGVEIVPSVAIFKDPQTLSKCQKLIKVKSNESLVKLINEIPDEKCPSFSLDYLVDLCKSLRGLKPQLSINICNFGLVDLTEKLMARLINEDQNNT